MNTEKQPTGKKLPFRTLIGYPMLGIGPTVQICLQMYFLLYFFTDILGLSATAAALVIMIARVWDFIDDPIVGMLLEKTKHPQKMTFWLKCSIVPVAIFTVLTYFAPDFSIGGRMIWAALMFACLGMSQSAYNVPYNALRVKLTEDRTERAKLNTFETIFSNLSSLFVSAVMMPLVAVISGFELSQPFMVLALIFVVFYMLMSFIGLGLTRGCEVDSDEVAVLNAESGKSVSVKEMLHCIATNKIAIMVIFIQTAKMLISTISGSAMVYYFQYNLGDSGLILMSLANTVGTVAGILPAFFFVPLHKKLGNAGSAILGCVLSLIAVSVRFVTHDANSTILILMFALEAAGIALSTSMLVQCLMDSIDYGEWKTGKRQSNIIMSTAGMGQKLGLAFGSSVAGIVIGAINYIPDAATQTEDILNAFFHMNVTIFMALYVVMLGMFIFMKRVEDKLPEMRAEIEARKKHNYSAE